MIKETIIQKLINKNHYKSYLEIGYQNGGSFSRILCAKKVSVDPDIKTEATYRVTSDQYFEKYRNKMDCVFIDGLHHAGQVERDIVNASKVLTKNGCISLHDLNPELEIQQLVPRQNKQWTGDCWRAFVGFRERYPDVIAYTHPEDWGVGIIYPKGQLFEPGFISDITFEEFMKTKEHLLNFV